MIRKRTNKRTDRQKDGQAVKNSAEWFLTCVIDSQNQKRI